MIRNKIVVIFFSISMTACRNNEITNDYQELKQSYWLYSRIIQVVDKNNEDVEFEFSNVNLTNKEADALIIVLQRKQYTYKVTLDSQIMISKRSASNIANLVIIESELRQVLHDTSSMWRWK